MLKSYHRSYPKYRVLFAKCTKIEVSSRIKDYFSMKHTCFCVLLVELNECYRLRQVLKELHEFSKSYHRSNPKYRVPLAKCTKIDVSSRIKDYFSKKHTCFCGLLVDCPVFSHLTSGPLAKSCHSTSCFPVMSILELFNSLVTPGASLVTPKGLAHSCQPWSIYPVVSMLVHLPANF